MTKGWQHEQCLSYYECMSWKINCSNREKHAPAIFWPPTEKMRRSGKEDVHLFVDLEAVIRTVSTVSKKETKTEGVMAMRRFTTY